MSIISFLLGVFHLFMSNFPAFVKKLASKISPELKSHLDIITDAVNQIKNFVGSPLADVLVQIIPGTLDDKIKDWLTVWIPVVLTNLGHLQNGIITLTGEPVERGAQIRGIASALTERYTGMSGDQSAITSTVNYAAKAA